MSWGLLGGILGASWGRLGGVLEASRGRLGDVLGRLEPSRNILKPLETSLGINAKKAAFRCICLRIFCVCSDSRNQYSIEKW